MAEHDLSIKSLGPGGDGIADFEGERIFVPFALPGEKLRANIENGRAAIIELLSTSPDRITAVCPHFGLCGGCQLQHLSADAMRAFKRDLVVRALAREGIEAEVDQLVEAGGIGRRRATLHGRAEGAGYNRARSHAVHPIDECPVLSPALSGAPAITRAIFSLIGNCDVSFTESLTGLDVAITTIKTKMRRPPPALATLANKHRLSRLTLNGEIIAQRAVPEVQMGRARVMLPIGAFLQATMEAETRLATSVLEACAGAKRVADLYCGIGTFAVRLAEQSQTFAVDADAASVAACSAALKATPGLKLLGSEIRDLTADPLTQEELKKFDVIVFDPPRAGAQLQAEEIARSGVKKAVAVSCNPQSFARDAKTLLQGGYRLRRVTPFDQFIHTPHVEIIGLFTKE